MCVIGIRDMVKLHESRWAMYGKIILTINAAVTLGLKLSSIINTTYQTLNNIKIILFHWQTMVQHMLHTNLIEYWLVGNWWFDSFWAVWVVEWLYISMPNKTTKANRWVTIIRVCKWTEQNTNLFFRHLLLDSLVVECWHQGREVPDSIHSQGPRHTKDVIKMIPVVPSLV